MNGSERAFADQYSLVSAPRVAAFRKPLDRAAADRGEQVL
jgi:hypothetical protein